MHRVKTERVMHSQEGRQKRHRTTRVRRLSEELDRQVGKDTSRSKGTNDRSEE